MERIAIFPGSFDPFTKGHEDIVLRGLKLFDQIIIAIGYNQQKKQRHFDIDLMSAKINETFKQYLNVSTLTYTKLTAKLAQEHKANYLLRGLRNAVDFEYENSRAQINKHLNSKLESVFLMTSPQFISINSSIVREAHQYKGDISAFLPYKL